jgi:hypothetical protein
MTRTGWDVDPDELARVVAGETDAYFARFDENATLFEACCAGFEIFFTRATLGFDGINGTSGNWGNGDRRTILTTSHDSRTAEGERLALEYFRAKGPKPSTAP